MNRITPEQVVEAYRVTGFVPVRGAFIKRDNPNDNCQMCGATAVAVAEKKVHWLDLLNDSSGRRERDIGAALGLDEWYLCGFTAGFDGIGRVNSFNYEAFITGYSDGRAAAAAVFPTTTNPEAAK